jgi:uncharacterized DUF497 family protein
VRARSRLYVHIYIHYRVEYVWDEEKARGNVRKHGVDLADAVTALCDELALTLSDEYEEEEGFVTIGMDAMRRVLLVVYTLRRDSVRIISARRATPRERRQDEG